MTTELRSHQRVDVELAERSYSIRIASGALRDTNAFSDLPAGGLGVIVTNSVVGPLYADLLRQQLANHYDRVLIIQLQDGERNKTWQSLERIFDALLAAHADRKTTLFALGGGVIGDLTGFASACYMRGVPYVQVPTTLLAQVDASVGGKTGINHPLGKNMIGAFHQPILIVADLETLDTLPQRELVSGIAEVIKYGPIADRGFFEWIEENIDALLRKDKEALAFAVSTSCAIKSSVVGADEREAGRRAILNFGHTFGHAIETATGYGTWSHGEAVGCGMVLAASLSARLGLIEYADAERLTRLIARAGLPIIFPPSIQTSRLLEIMRLDKKSEGGNLRVVLLKGIGDAGVYSATPEMVSDVIAKHRTP